jgi:hypothetical protein
MTSKNVINAVKNMGVRIPAQARASFPKPQQILHFTGSVDMRSQL